MKIHYSPYFNGKAYIDYSKHNGGLLGECVESTAGLLSRLELFAGLSYQDCDDNSEERRKEAYYKVLQQVIKDESTLYNSFLIDTKEIGQSSTDPQYRVTAEILSWRDHLILAGWDTSTTLPGKLAVISEAEKLIDTASPIHSGYADRWLAISKHTDILKAASLEVSVYCPKILIPNLIKSIIDAICTPIYISIDENIEINIEESHCKVLSFYELTDAYEWLAQQTPDSTEVVVCKEDSRLDSALRTFNKPEAMSDNPDVGSHHIIKDPRCLIDIPHSLVWLDCNRDYGFTYPYSFISNAEMQELDYIPSKEAMLQATHSSMAHALNSIDQITLITSQKDFGTTLSEHPFVSAMLHPVGQEARTPEHPTLVFGTTEEKEEKRFKKAKSNEVYTYNLHTDSQAKDHVYSQSSIERLLNVPLDFVIERAAGLKEPFDTTLRNELGQFAHSVVEYMVDTYKDVSVTYFDEMVERVKTENTFVNLYSPENCFIFENLIRTLKSSIATLSSIISQQGLKPVGCEIDINGKLEGIGDTTAKVDMILQKSDTEYVIFDFKYSTSEFYYKKLATNSSIQLDFYKESFDHLGHSGTDEKYSIPEGAKIVAYGYYQFPLFTLFVPEGPLGSDVLFGNNIEVIQLDTDNAITDPISDIKARMSQINAKLKNGEIEYSQVNDNFPKHIVLKDLLR